VDIRRFLFKYRSYTPIPLLAAALALAEPTAASAAAGLALVLAGEGLRFWGVAYAGCTTRITASVAGHRLVTDGPFAHVRNPLYCGNFVLSLGLLVAAWAWMPWLALVFILLFALQYGFIVNLEEQFLEEKFGEAYRAYRAAVPAWAPRPTPYPGRESLAPDWKRALRSERNTLQSIVIVLALIAVRAALRG
jgi:protein-S-isoprenylcysteine O-methyltransferase Ste14